MEKPNWIWGMEVGWEEERGTHTHQHAISCFCSRGGEMREGGLRGKKEGNLLHVRGRPPAWWVGWGGKERLVQF